MKKHEVVYKKRGDVFSDIIEARNQSSAVEKCKEKHNTTHILKVRKPKINYRKMASKLFGGII